MENSFDKSPKNNDFGQNQYVTRSAKVMIKFPLQKDDDNYDDDYIDEIKNQEPPSPDKNGELVIGDKTLVIPRNTNNVKKNELLFCGVVKDDNNKVLEGVAVMVFACYTDGIEKLQGYGFTDSDGTYIVTIKDPPNYNGLEEFKVRAGQGSQASENNKKKASDDQKTYKDYLNREFYDFLKSVYNTSF